MKKPNFKVSPLPGHFGTEVTHIDVSSDQLSDEVFKELLNVLYENRFMVLRDQHLSKGEYLAFGRRFGTPIPHVLKDSRMPDFPEMMTISNTKIVGDQPHNGAAHWHTDQSYEADPANATMLYCIQAPRKGGETQFCDMMSAYKALPEDTKASIEHIEVEHRYGAGIARRAIDLTPARLGDQDQEQIDTAPLFVHPLVKRHPVTGRKTLYSVAGTSQGIRGMALDEARKLLLQLGDHAFQDRFLTKHKYRENDLLVWDTIATMHAAAPIFVLPEPEDVRVLYRISVRGIPPVYES